LIDWLITAWLFINVQRAVLNSGWEQVQQFINRIYNVYRNEGRDGVNGVNKLNECYHKN
jgi:hypothetical protein